MLAAGDTIRTGDAASVEITYVDGSTVRVDENAESVVMTLSSDASAASAVDRAWRVITKLFAGNARYDARTPSATASIRGLGAE